MPPCYLMKIVWKAKAVTRFSKLPKLGWVNFEVAASGYVTFQLLGELSMSLHAHVLVICSTISRSTGDHCFRDFRDCLLNSESES